nr:NUDIX hydrolase [Arsenicicoccus piscis]
MPLKRNIAQGVVWDEQGRVLLCETTYKRDWDLPGGIVDPDEPPSKTVERELHEELGADVVAGALLTVAWLPRYKGWSDATLFVFDLGSRDQLPEHLDLQTREIRAVHWADRATVATRCAPYAARLLHLLMDRRDAGATGTVYVVDGEPHEP